MSTKKNKLKKFKIKYLGRTLKITSPDGKIYTNTFKDASVRKEIVDLIKLYNIRNSIKRAAKIISFFKLKKDDVNIKLKVKTKVKVSKSKTKTKTSKSTKSSKSFKMRSIGQNIIIISPDGEKYSKRFANKVERDSVKSLILEYNTRNSIKRAKAIITIFTKNIEDNKTKIASKKAIARNKKKGIKLSRKNKDIKLDSTTAAKITSANKKSKKVKTNKRKINVRGEY